MSLPPVPIQCSGCRRFQGMGEPRKLGRFYDWVPLVCDAFKDIPRDIRTGKFDHTKPHKGDHGIQYEPRTD